MYDLSVYDAEFYATFGPEAKRMAPWLMPLLNRVIPFESLVDVGCGQGYYLHWLYAVRPDCFPIAGIEGSQAAIDKRVFGVIGKHDLRFPYRNPNKFDIAFSLEVAEHIEEEYAPVFVDTLCNLSDTVVITAAPPGQGGLMHCNERDRDYWKKLFWDQDFHPDHEALRKLREGIASAQNKGEYVTPWLNGNLMVFRRAS